MKSSSCLNPGNLYYAHLIHSTTTAMNNDHWEAYQRQVRWIREIRQQSTIDPRMLADAEQTLSHLMKGLVKRQEWVETRRTVVQIDVRQDEDFVRE